jgi:predicted nuclease of predicted toxin-antitoxin system
MKLLFDQNLSPRLPNQLEDIFPGPSCKGGWVDQSNGYPYLGICQATQLILISKDADFHQRSLLFGPPPQVIWIRLGNCSVSEIELLLRNQKQKIQQFSADKKRSLLLLS